MYMLEYDMVLQCCGPVDVVGTCYHLEGLMPQTKNTLNPATVPVLPNTSQKGSRFKVRGPVGFRIDR